MGCSSTNFTCTDKFVDPDNTLLGAGMGDVSPIQAELLPILCSNNSGWLPLQQGSVMGKFEGYHSIGRPRKPLVGANSVHVSSRVPEL